MRVLIGLSGGADSVALTRILLREGKHELFAVHVNHGLRGEESDGDEAFVRQLCETLGIPLNCFRLQPPLKASEGWAREERYRAFRQAYDACGADALALAHHRDDQAETVLEHLLRGSGTDGLCGMRPETTIYGMRVIRPLLNVSRDDLKEELCQLQQEWREDSSNSGETYLRNRVRHRLLPLMEMMIPGVTERICHTAAIVASEVDALEQLAAEWLSRYAGNCLPVEPLRALPSGLMNRVLRDWLKRETGNVPDYEHTKALSRLPEEKNGASVPLSGGTVRRGWTHLHWLPDAAVEVPAEVCELTGCGEYRVGQAVITCAPGTGHGDGMETQGIVRLPEGCVLRTRRQGDRIRPWGQSGSQSLQDYFVNRHVDAPFRDKVPLLCCGSEVLWVAGIGGGALEKVNDEQPVLMLTLTGLHPWTEGRMI